MIMITQEYYFHKIAFCFCWVEVLMSLVSNDTRYTTMNSYMCCNVQEILQNMQYIQSHICLRILYSSHCSVHRTSSPDSCNAQYSLLQSTIQDIRTELRQTRRITGKHSKPMLQFLSFSRNIIFYDFEITATFITYREF